MAGLTMRTMHMDLVRVVGVARMGQVAVEAPHTTGLAAGAIHTDLVRAAEVIHMGQVAVEALHTTGLAT
jgi:hypothetical protein